MKKKGKRQRLKGKKGEKGGKEQRKQQHKETWTAHAMWKNSLWGVTTVTTTYAKGTMSSKRPQGSETN